MKGTEDSHVLLQTAILNAFALKQELVAVFFDSQKAYDTAWRYGILKAVHQVGLRDRLAFFIQDFIRDRQFKTKIGSCVSERQEQEQSVPQCSVLSCSSFAMAINDVITVILQSVNVLLYVDYLVIYTSGSYIPAIERRLQQTIKDVNDWTIRSGFTICTDKTVAVQFHSKRRLPNEPSLTLDGKNISFETHKNFLWLVYDQIL